jgi:hypothetical protein
MYGAARQSQAGGAEAAAAGQVILHRRSRLGCDSSSKQVSAVRSVEVGRMQLGRQQLTRSAAVKGAHQLPPDSHRLPGPSEDMARQ